MKYSTTSFHRILTMLFPVFAIGCVEDKETNTDSNTPPSVAFVEPVDGDTYTMGDPVRVLIQVVDVDMSDLSSITLDWGGSITSPDAPTHPNADGTGEFFLFDLVTGNYALSVSASDPIGSTDSATLTFSILNVDIDGDGFIDAAQGGDDCDDSNDTIHPNATELCNNVDDDCDGDIDNNASDMLAWYDDRDGDDYGDDAHVAWACEAPDGHVAVGGDCADDDATRHPGAIERCDDTDNDCNGLTDEGTTTIWYYDGDGDGYGLTTAVQAACEVPDGYSGTGGDCDDAARSTHPGGFEICDGIDQDCDGTVDDGVLEIYYTDSDGDGYGDRTNTIEACTVPIGYTTRAEDCDDTSSAVNPGEVETCANSVDDNCDGVTDETPTWYIDADGDGHGVVTSTQLACIQPIGYANIADDCNDSEASVHPNATEVCDGADVDEDCDGAADDIDTSVDIGTMSTFNLDLDGDGFAGTTTVQACDPPTNASSSLGDCNDTSMSVHPNVDDICNGVDDDCDGTVDELTTWYADADTDGYGDPTTTVTACMASAGWITTGGDCDDTNANVNPGAVEVCDIRDTDEDCDGLADDVDPDTELTEFYSDSDGDGYGDDTIATMACDKPVGYARSGGDCDDAEVNAYPGGTEVCGDGVDNDCDGIAGVGCRFEGSFDETSADITFYGENASNRTGEGNTTNVGDLDGDGMNELFITTLTSPSIGWLVYPPVAEGEYYLANDAHARFNWPSTTLYSSGAPAGDVNGDGFGDLILGATANTANVAAYIFYGPLSGTVNFRTADATLTSNYVSSIVVGSTGDVDGDGRADVYVSDASENDVYFMTGVGSGSASLSNAWATFHGGSVIYYGKPVTMGDTNGDGYDDLLLCEQMAECYIYFGPFATGEYTLSDADVTFTGLRGSDIRTGGDVNCDGNIDTIISRADERMVSVFYGPLMNGTLDAAYADLTFTGTSSSAAPGNAGDVDGDGCDDLMILSSLDTGLLYYGSPSFYTGTMAATAYPDLEIDLAGGSRNAANNMDFDGDGLADIIVSQPLYTTYDAYGAVEDMYIGAVRVYLTGNHLL